MKNTLLFALCLICIVINTTAQNNTTQDFNLPKTTTVYVAGTVKYNGETKQITPTKQIQYEFKNGLLLSEKEQSIIGNLKLAGIKTYSYDANNNLTRILDAGGIKTDGTDGSGSQQEYKISYNKSGNTVYIQRNSQPFINKTYNTTGKLLEEAFYDYSGKYVMKKHIYNNGVKITKKQNPENKVTEETTEYLNKNNEPIVSVLFDIAKPYLFTVTYYTYSANGDLQSSTECKYYKDKLKPNFEFFKDGKPTEVPKDASFLNPTTTTFYNYSEGATWSARIPNSIYNNEIQVTLRVLQTSDGKANIIMNNQVAFMAFLDATYKTIKASKP